MRMRMLRLSFLLPLLWMATPTLADDAMVVTTCGSPAQTYVAGVQRPITQDTTGKGCVAISGTVTATQPTGTTTEAKVTVAVTSTYQQALAASATRKGCTIQYIAVGGTKGYVFFGSAPADTTTSFQLTNGQAINCGAPGVTLTDAVQVTGTGTDIFVVSNQ